MTYDDLGILSQSLIGNQWKWLGRPLKIDEPTLSSIDLRWPDLAEKAYQMLLKWKQKNASGATYRGLCVALCDKLVSCRDLAEKICFRTVS